MNDGGMQNHNGNGFPHVADPNAPPVAVAGMLDPAAFMANPGQFNPTGQFANPQQMMVMPGPNGAMRNASPSFQNPMYQTNSVIPSKRPRPREDSLVASPHQNAGMLPTSRAETPQQAHFANFPPGSMPPQQNTTQTYAHLPPNGSANATPSPIMGNQIRAGSAPQRVSTTSPHPFSPATQSFVPQASPVPSDPSPAPPQNPYAQVGNFPPGFNPNYTPTPPPGRPSPNPQQAGSQMMRQHMGQMPQAMGQMPQMGPGMGQMGQMGQLGQMSPMGAMNPMAPMSQPPNSMLTPVQQQLGQARNPLDQQKLMYQMQLQRQLQQGNMQAAAHMQGQNISAQQRSMIARQQQQQQQQQQQAQQQQAHAQQQQQQQHPPPQSGPNGQVPPSTPKSSHPPGLPQQGAPRSSPDQFLQQLSLFMNRMNMPLDINPIVGDRPVHLMLLFQTVQKFNGYRGAMQGNGWLQVATALGFPPQQAPAVAGQIRAIYEHNLLKFEEFVAQTRAKTSQQYQQQQQQHTQQQHQQHQQPQVLPPHLPQQDQGGPVGAPSTPKPATRPGQGPPSQRMPPAQPPQSFKHGMHNGQQPNMNGISTPHAPQPPHLNSHQPPPPSSRPSLKSNASRSIHGTLTHEEFHTQSPAPSKMGGAMMPRGQFGNGHDVPAEASVGMLAPPFGVSDEYKPCSRESHTYGGLDVHAPVKVVSDILRFRPELPAPNELGNIDIHALTKSIQSGIRGEVRLALDTLATVTVSNLPGLEIDLDKCDDLLESLIEYAEELVEVLAESTAEVSDEILIPPYEDIARACQLERLSIRDEPEVGSEEEELERAVNYILCITTILRNLSFNPRNQVGLADESVVKFLCQVIRYVGTRNMLLRTQLNMLDFMKDVIILLSNISGSIEIPDREEALCFLMFLLAFGPTPLPSLSDACLFFPTYQPTLHPYLPAAVDALAKLLARDEPNRTHFRTVFGMDIMSIAPSDLLTQTFALAISPIPEHVREMRPRHLPPIVEVRKPILMQGLLAADIVASLAPGYESGLTRAWLVADNGFAHNLHRTVRDLCLQFESVEIHARQYGLRERPIKDAELMYIVVLAISMLRKLSEKAVDPNDPSSSLPPSVLPSEDGLLEALEMISGEWSRDGFLHNLVAFASLGNK